LTDLEEPVDCRTTQEKDLVDLFPPLKSQNTTPSNADVQNSAVIEVERQIDAAAQQGHEMSLLPPLGYDTIDQAKAKYSQSMNVIAIVEDYMPPAKSTGSG
jgi:hypothetical protein